MQIAWLTVIINGILTGIVAWLLKKVTTAFDKSMAKAEAERLKQEEEREVLHNVLLAVMRDSLYERCFRALDAGQVGLKEKENIDSLYTQYHTLGGNHNGDKLYARVEQLKLIRDADD